MGDVGPCGPCSEIHFDRGEKYGTGPEDKVNGETDRFVEIWNLVFMQYEQLPGGEVVPLPRPSVDTGAGLERIASILQGCDTNYGIDLFQNIIRAISKETGARYDDNRVSHHVVADHVRALTFSIADGAGISNEGRGYVLRRILRRAARHGRNLGAHEPFIYKLIPVLVNEMGEAYPEIREKQDHVMNVIRAEEESFGRTLETGLELFDRVAKKTRATGAKIVSGDEVFRLYDTYGFPYDLTETIANEQGLTLDQAGFEKAMAEQQERSRAGSSFADVQAQSLRTLTNILEKENLLSLPVTEFCRQGLTIDAKVLTAAVSDNVVGVVLDKSPFYVESGGQISDLGTIASDQWPMNVQAMANHRGYYIHLGQLTRGSFDDLLKHRNGTATVDSSRRWDVMRNHTATHLLHKALRMTLGEHVKQSGSYVGPDRLRFDFSHHQPMTPDEIRRVEEIVNQEIIKGTPVETKEMPVEEAKKSGAMALFGEKYGDTVRVVSVPPFSKELCGGTHVQNVGQIGSLIVTLETGIASGVRRIEAITGREATEYLLSLKRFRQQVAQMVNRPEPEALKGLEALKESNASLQREIKKTKQAMFTGGSGSVGDEVNIGAVAFLSHDFGEADTDTIAAWIDSVKDKPGPIIAVGMAQANGKVAVTVAANARAMQEHKLSAGDIAKEIFPRFGGRGGGKPTFAQGSVAVGTDSRTFFDAIAQLLTTRVGA
jgi:alanyl-tRNA synthetase